MRLRGVCRWVRERPRGVRGWRPRATHPVVGGVDGVQVQVSVGEAPREGCG